MYQDYLVKMRSLQDTENNRNKEGSPASRTPYLKNFEKQSSTTKHSAKPSARVMNLSD